MLLYPIPALLVPIKIPLCQAAAHALHVFLWLHAVALCHGIELSHYVPAATTAILMTTAAPASTVSGA